MRYSTHLLVCGLIETIGFLCNIIVENYIVGWILLELAILTCLAAFIIRQIESKEKK